MVRKIDLFSPVASNDNLPLPILVATGALLTVMHLSVSKGVPCPVAVHIDLGSTNPNIMLGDLLNVSRLTNMGWTASIQLEEGIRQTDDWYLANQGSLRAT